MLIQVYRTLGEKYGVKYSEDEILMRTSRPRRAPPNKTRAGALPLMGKTAELVQWRRWAGSTVAGDLRVGAVGARRLRRFRFVSIFLPLSFPPCLMDEVAGACKEWVEHES